MYVLIAKMVYCNCLKVLRLTFRNQDDLEKWLKEHFINFTEIMTKNENHHNYQQYKLEALQFILPFFMQEHKIMNAFYIKGNIN